MLIGGPNSLGGTSMALAGSVRSEFEDMKLIIGTEGGQVTRYLVARPLNQEKEGLRS